MREPKGEREREKEREGLISMQRFNCLDSFSRGSLWMEKDEKGTENNSDVYFLDFSKKKKLL